MNNYLNEVRIARDAQKDPKRFYQLYKAKAKDRILACTHYFFKISYEDNNQKRGSYMKYPF